MGDEFAGQPWCICIWAYSNYILQNKDLPLKCESIPSKVLEEQYSLDKFKQCGSMSSTVGCGSEDIRRSIESLCQQCDDQAADQASKNALKGKCDGILASAPAAPLARGRPSRFYSEGTPNDEGFLSLDGKLGTPLSIIALTVLTVAGISVGIVRWTSGRFRQTRGSQPAIEVSVAEQQFDDDESMREVLME